MQLTILDGCQQDCCALKKTYRGGLSHEEELLTGQPHGVNLDNASSFIEVMHPEHVAIFEQAKPSTWTQETPVPQHDFGGSILAPQG